jgi:hypothetical protein
MGRGRAKAKQTRVARELKYHSPNTDLAALQRELAGNRGSDPVDDQYDEYQGVDEESDDADDGDDADDPERDDGGSWASRRR